MIADAALEIIAEEGARSLSHRAIDRRLALPLGSTSYYFRTRRALLDAAVQRMVELDEQDVAAIIAAGHGLDTPERALEFNQQLVQCWADKSHRSRLAARFELLLEAARTGADHPLMAARKRFLNSARASMRGYGAQAAVRMVAALDGLLLHELLGVTVEKVGLRSVIDSVEQWVTAAPCAAGRGRLTSGPKRARG